MNTEEKLINEATAFNRGMLENTIKIMSGKFGGGFYVNYQFDKMNGMGFLKLILEYPDGDVFAIPMCKNVGKPIEEEQDGVGTAKEILGPDAPSFMKRREIAPQISDMKYYAKRDAFIKFERPDFPIPIDVIWRRIAELWERIPVDTWCGTFTYGEVYQALLDVGEGKAEQYRDDACVLLTRKEIEEVVADMGYDFLTIRNVFEGRHLWKKDRSSMGYQYSKKINGKVERFYALKKIVAVERREKVNEEFAIDYMDCVAK